MKRPRILISLMIQRRERAEMLWRQRAYARACGVVGKTKHTLFKRSYVRNERLPRITIHSLLRLAARSRVYAFSRWQSHDSETYSACGYDDYQSELRVSAGRNAREYSKAARFLKGVR